MAHRRSGTGSLGCVTFSFSFLPIFPVCLWHPLSDTAIKPPQKLYYVMKRRITGQKSVSTTLTIVQKVHIQKFAVIKAISVWFTMICISLSMYFFFCATIYCTVCACVYTHPECVSVEDVWVTTSLAREEDRTCCVLWLQLGPIMLPWLCGCCRGSMWGWCSCGCGGACWVIQDCPLWERIWGWEGWDAGTSCGDLCTLSPK